jgi:hypothetical protein
MAKWFGVIGFADSIETSPGVWKEQIIEKSYYGNVNRISRRLQAVNQLNDNIVISDEISIVADPFANDHFHKMRYVSYLGTNWKIANADASQRPRINLILGGEWNGEQA